MKKYLITGGAGFIGSNFLHYMVKKYPNDTFVCLDILSYAGNYNNIKELESNDNYVFVYGNIGNTRLVNKLFKKYNFDYIVNFAAESSVDKSIEDPNVFIENNVYALSKLLNVAKNYNIKRFHQISTDEVYGDIDVNEEYSFKETDRLNPSNPYSASKASAELLLASFGRTYDFPYTISRCTNNYGPRQFLEKLIPRTITNIMNNEKMFIHGDGTNVRDWLPVLEHVKAIELILFKGKDKNIYNIAGHQEYDNNYVVKSIIKYLNKSNDLIEYVTNRLGNDKKYSLDTTKIEKELGFYSNTNFDEEVQNTIDWYSNNQKWIKSIINKEYLTAYNPKEHHE